MTRALTNRPMHRLTRSLSHRLTNQLWFVRTWRSDDLLTRLAMRVWKFVAAMVVVAAQPSLAQSALRPPATATTMVAAQPPSATRSRGNAARANAVRAKAAAAHTVAAMRTIDNWLVARYRGVELLPDSVVDGADNDGTANKEKTSTGADAAYPRVESVIATALTDTLLALQFGAQTGRAPFASGATVRMSGPTGAISSATARIVARRAFRVASKPLVSHANDSAWRYGWAYVAVVSRSARTTGGVVVGGGFRNWMLMEGGDSLRRH